MKPSSVYSQSFRLPRYRRILKRLQRGSHPLADRACHLQICQVHRTALTVPVPEVLHTDSTVPGLALEALRTGLTVPGLVPEALRTGLTIPGLVPEEVHTDLTVPGSVPEGARTDFGEVGLQPAQPPLYKPRLAIPGKQIIFIIN